MGETKPYKCVNCGQNTGALYRTYGPSVLKLNKCENCKGIVDKYIEYDSVIVMIDLVLVSKEAQRHVIYNTEFKSYWKLFIILMLLETYGIWRNDSLFNIVVNSLCDIKTNSTINSTYLHVPAGVRLPGAGGSAGGGAGCGGWSRDERDDSDLFIWEKDFYIQFLSTFSGIAVFILTIYSTMNLVQSLSKRKKVAFGRLLRAFSLGNASVLLTLPALVWGGAEPPAPRAAHYALAHAYHAAVLHSVLTVVYESTMCVTALVLAASYCAKYAVTYVMTPCLRQIVT